MSPMLTVEDFPHRILINVKSESNLEGRI